MSMLNCFLMEIPLLLFSHRQMGATYSRILFQVRILIKLSSSVSLFLFFYHVVILALHVCSRKFPKVPIFQVSCYDQITSMSDWLQENTISVHPIQSCRLKFAVQQRSQIFLVLHLVFMLPCCLNFS